MTESRHRIFYHRDSERGLNTVDCKMGKSGVFYPADDSDTDIKAIHIKEDDSEALLSNNEVEEIIVKHIREKEHEYEQYIYGGQASSTKTYVCFEGEYSARKRLPEYKGSVNVRINNNSIVKGNSNSTTSIWEWTTRNEGDTSIEVLEPDSQEMFSKTTVIIGCEEPIDVIELVRPIFVSEDGELIDN